MSIPVRVGTTRGGDVEVLVQRLPPLKRTALRGCRRNSLVPNSDPNENGSTSSHGGLV
jgi:hypothetical protein